MVRPGLYVGSPGAVDCSLFDVHVGVEVEVVVGALGTGMTEPQGDDCCSASAIRRFVAGLSRRVCAVTCQRHLSRNLRSVGAWCLR